MTIRDITSKWVEEYPEVKRWLAKLQAKERNAYDLYRFCQWARKTPLDLLNLKKDPASKGAEFLLDSFVADEKTGFTNGVKFNMVGSVRSFFKHNYLDLAKASGAILVEKVKPYNKPKKEDLRRLWTWAQNLRDKALLTFVCSTAIAKETLSRLQWKHLEEGWEKIDLPSINVPPELLKGHGIGRYKGVRQITFLTPEAKRDLIAYKEWIEKKLKRKLTGEDNVFLQAYAPYEPISYKRLGHMLWILTRDAGIPFTWHDARRYVNTAMEEIRISPNWARVIRGRKVKGEEAPYSRPVVEQLRAKFREAVPILEFTTEPAAVSKEVEERLKALEAFKASLTPEQLEAATKAGYRFRTEVTPVKTFKKAMQKQRKTKTDCENGEHCEEFKQISEADLLQHLRGGWTIAHKLSNGEVIVRRSSA